MCKRFERLPFLLFSAALLSVAMNFLFVAHTSAVPKGLTLSPLRTELEISPGTSIDGVLEIGNSTDQPMKVVMSAEEFSVINQQYDYAFTQESQLANWVEFTPSEVTLAPEERKKIEYRVGAPLSAEPGGRYVGLFSSTDTAGANGGVVSRQRIASLLYITVNGDVTRSGHLVNVSSPWLIGGQSTWTMTLQNTGTTHFRSRYSVNVQDVLGKATGVQVTGDSMVLPGTVRTTSDALPVPRVPGIYKYVYTIGLGDSPAVSETRIVLYLPPAAGVLVGVIVLLFTTWIVRRKSTKR